MEASLSKRVASLNDFDATYSYTQTHANSLPLTATAVEVLIRFKSTPTFDDSVRVKERKNSRESLFAVATVKYSGSR